MKLATILVLVLGWLVMADALAAQPVGRLFYTPQQRQQIDNQHKPHTPRPLRAQPKDAHYNGYVIRSDGVNTIWVNGQTRYVDQSMLNDGQLKLPATPALKPGQAFDRQAGRVLETYEISLPAVKPIVPAAPLILPPLTDERDDSVLVDNVAVP